MDVAMRAQKQALGLQRKLESELDSLDVMDKHYDRKYESLNRRLDEVFDAIEEADKKVSECEAKLDSIKKQNLSRDSIYESLKIFDKLYTKMSDLEKKNFVRSFIDHIDLEQKVGRHGMPIKNIKFKFPVAFDGSSVYDFWTPSSTTVETVVLLSSD